MWTKEKVLEEASKLTTMKELEENKALSSAAFRLGFRDEATKHIADVNGVWFVKH